MEAFSITSLMIFKGELLQTFELSQRQDLAMLFLKINDYGIIALEVFWGLWLIPFGHLVYKSGFIPPHFWNISHHCRRSLYYLQLCNYTLSRLQFIFEPTNIIIGSIGRTINNSVAFN